MKVIRLKESDIQHIVKRVLNEQEGEFDKLPYIEAKDPYGGNKWYKLPSDSEDGFGALILNDDLFKVREDEKYESILKIPKSGNYQLVTTEFGNTEFSLQLDNIKGNREFNFIYQFGTGNFRIIDKKTGKIVFTGEWSWDY